MSTGTFLKRVWAGKQLRDDGERYEVEVIGFRLGKTSALAAWQMLKDYSTLDSHTILYMWMHSQWPYSQLGLIHAHSSIAMFHVA